MKHYQIRRSLGLGFRVVWPCSARGCKTVTRSSYFTFREAAEGYAEMVEAHGTRCQRHDKWLDNHRAERGGADWGLVGVVALAIVFVAVISVGMIRSCNAANAEEPSVAGEILGAARDAAAWAKRAAGVPDWVEGPAPGGWIPGLWCDAPLADGSRDCAQANLAEHGVTALVPDGWYCDDLGGGTACGPAPGGWRCVGGGP